MDSTEAAGNAKSRMKSAGIGLVLTLISFLILQTLNSAFINPDLTPLPQQDGVYVSDDSYHLQPISDAVENTATLPAGTKKIVYFCHNTSSIIIWKFPKVNLEKGNSLSDVKMVRKKCGEEETLSGTGSFKWAYDIPGIYYCLGSCDSSGLCGYMSASNKYSQNEIDPLFAGKMGAIRVVNSPQNKVFFGIIFHKEKGLTRGGECGAPEIFDDDYKEVSCVNRGSDNDPKLTIAADIFQINKTAVDSGTGVNLFSADTGWDANQRAGRYEVASDKINYKEKKDPGTMCFDYTGVNRSNLYKKKCSDSKCGNVSPAPVTPPPGQTPSQTPSPTPQPAQECSELACETVKDCPGSLQINKHFLVGIYSQDTIKSGGYDTPSGPLYCQTFTSDVKSFNSTQILKPGDKDIDGIYIIPIK